MYSLTHLYNSLQLILQITIGIVVLFHLINIVDLSWVMLCILGAQLIAVFEIYNALKGTTKSHPVTSAMQVFARIAVSTTLYFYVGIGPDWIILLLGACWALADGVRCLYYLKKSISVFSWMRYNLFLILYPLGMTLENIVVWHVINANSINPYALYLPFLLLYGFSAVKMYRHMLQQRSRYYQSDTRNATFGNNGI